MKDLTIQIFDQHGDSVSFKKALIPAGAVIITINDNDADAFMVDSTEPTGLQYLKKVLSPIQLEMLLE